MTRDDIIRMAEEAGLWWQEYEGRICPDRVGAGDIEKFAQLVAAAERAACAQVADVAAARSYTWGRKADALDIATTIRART